MSIESGPLVSMIYPAARAASFALQLSVGAVLPILVGFYWGIDTKLRVDAGQATQTMIPFFALLGNTIDLFVIGKTGLLALVLA